MLRRIAALLILPAFMPLASAKPTKSKTIQRETQADYIERMRQQSPEMTHASVGSLWTDNGRFANLGADYSTAQVDKKKAGQLAVAIHLAFQQLGAYPAASSNLESVAIPLTPTSPVALPPIAEPTGLDDLRKELGQALAPEILRGEVGLREVRDGLVISLREGGFFDSGVAGVKANAQPALSRMATVLAESNHNLRIEGHTDNVRIHNAHFNSNSNWELSTARSTEMVRLLIEKYGFAPQRLSASGYGEFHPIASNDTLAGRALNRRVDVVVLSDRIPASQSPEAPVVGIKQ